MKKTMLILALVVFVSLGAAQADNFSASFDTYYAGQTNETPSFQLNNVMPGDSGMWLIDVELNGTYGIYLTLNETNSSENGCIEPEAEAEPGCNGDGEGELGDEMNFTAWIDSNDNRIHEQGERFVILENWTYMSNPGNFLGDLSPTDEKNLVVKWELPETATNAVQTDSIMFDLIAANGPPGEEDDSNGGNGGGDGDSDTDSTTTVLGDDSSSSDIGQGRLEVTVENETGTGLEGASVEVSGNGIEIGETTDGSGLAVFNLDEGEYMINASLDGYSHDTASEAIEDGVTSEVSLTLELEPSTTSGQQEQQDNETDEGTGQPQTPAGGFFQSQPGIVGLVLLLLAALLVIAKRNSDVLERFNPSR